ncbi:MAG: methyltransferase domain-containing protein, partial [Syntrophaceae bacterium]
AEGSGILKYTCIEKDPEIKKALDYTWAMKFGNIPLRFEEDISGIGESFDCIVLSHVVEHVYNPGDIIRQAAGKLRDKGIIFIDVPHQDYKFKEDVFPHVLFFTPDVLGKLLKDAAVKVISAECFGNDMDNSPIKPQLFGMSADNVTKLITKLSAIAPKNIVLGYFSYIFRMAEQNQKGIWIRAIGQKIPLA